MRVWSCQETEHSGLDSEFLCVRVEVRLSCAGKMAGTDRQTATETRTDRDKDKDKTEV